MDLAHAATAALLGVVEGLTEFLPVSSTGHLIVAEALTGFRDPAGVFTVVIQLGAILAVCVHYRRRLWELCRGALAGDRAAWAFIANLVVATLPAVIVGLALEKLIDEHLLTVPVVIATLALGGFAILLIERRRAEPRVRDAAAMRWTTALGIGCCQVLAIVAPGTSRSGASILGAMLLGHDRRAATEFSFFLAIPAMLGASGLKLAKHHAEIGAGDATAIAVGFAVSFVVALAVVAWLLRWVSRRDFRPFAWYRLAAALVLAGLLVGGAIGARPASAAAVPAAKVGR